MEEKEKQELTVPAADDPAVSETAENTQQAQELMEEEPIEEERRVFGVPYHIFQGGALGFACGLIICGLIGHFLNRSFTSYIVIFACVGVGGFLAKRFFGPKK